MAKQKLNLDELPSNNERAPNKRPMKANFRGEVRVRGNRGSLASEVRDVFNSQFSNMMMPSIMRLIYDFLEGALRMMILKEGSPGKSYGISRTAYNRRYRSVGPTYYRAGESPQRRTIQETPYEPIIFTDRRDAEAIRHQMMEIIEEYGWCSVGHLYSICDEPHNFSHHRWGWTDISGVGIGRVSDGFYIDLPNPVAR